MKTLLLAFRPKTLIASVSPVCIGSAMAYAKGDFVFWVFLFTVLTGLGIQISTNLANDLFDYLKGADTKMRKGPVRVTASGLMSVVRIKWAIFSVMCFTALMGSVLVLRGGMLIGCLVALALVIALAYTAGPLPLAYLGLGEVFVLLFFGPVATGLSYYLHTLSFSLKPFLAGLSPGLISCTLLIVNNLRDIDEDRAANKKTLVARFGSAFGKWECIFCLMTACLIPLFLYEKNPLILLSLLCLIPASQLCLAVLKNRDPYAYNPILGQTGKLLWLYTFIFALSYVL